MTPAYYPVFFDVHVLPGICEGQTFLVDWQSLPHDVLFEAFRLG